MTAFSWWTFSLIQLSYEVHVDDNDKLGYEVHKATRTVLQNSKFKPDDDTAFNQLKLGTHVIYFDTVRMRKLIKTTHPYAELTFDSGKVTIIPAPDMVKKLESDKKRRIGMYVTEGVVFLALLLAGFSWIYNRLTSMVRLNQQKNNFLLAVTHELKTPMAGVKLFLQTLQRRELTKEQRDIMIQHCVEDVDRLNDLAENMLLATRIEGKSYQYNFETVDFSALVSGITEKYMEKYGNSYDIQDDVEDNIELEIDVFSVTIAINNLVENALKYTPKGGVIKVSLKREEDGVALCIADEGPGIPKDERLNVFTKFYRLGSESTRTTKGTGLGLYIVKQITGNHKAEINILENKPKGTVFKISFRPKAA